MPCPALHHQQGPGSQVQVSPLPPPCPSGLATFGVPCPLATPGLWCKAPLGALLQDQGLRVCHTPEGKPVLVCLTAASLPPDAQPEASWDRSSRWGGAHPECCQLYSHTQVPSPQPVSIHLRRAVSCYTQDLSGLAEASNLAQAAQDTGLPAPFPTSFALGYPHKHSLSLGSATCPPPPLCGPTMAPTTWDTGYERKRVCMLLQDTELPH